MMRQRWGGRGYIFAETRAPLRIQPHAIDLDMSHPAPGRQRWMGIMTHTHDAMHDAAESWVTHPVNLNVYRANATLAFDERVVLAVDDDGAELSSMSAGVRMTGPRGAQEFARMLATDSLPDSIANISLAESTAAARQMMGIMRWLLACNGNGADVLQDVLLRMIELEFTTREISVRNVIMMTPFTIAKREDEREAERGMMSKTPFEWLTDQLAE